MKQMCVARNLGDVHALLSHAEIVMAAMTADPDRDDVYQSLGTRSPTGGDVLPSLREVDIHTSAPQDCITLKLNSGKSIDGQIATLLDPSRPSPKNSGELKIHP